MAGIDKTYVTVPQWKLAKKFHSETIEKQKKELGDSISLYYTEDEIFEDCVLWNTSYIQDIWLRKNCDLDFIQNRLDYQYGKEGLKILSEKCTFEQNGVYFYEIETNQNSIYFFYREDEDNIWLIDEKDTILIYGTTYIFKIINTAINALTDRTPFEGKISFSFFGWNLTYENGVIKDDNTEVGIQIHKKFFKLPKFKLSFNSKDAKKFNPNYIYFSDEDSLNALTDYKDYENMKYLDKSIKMGRFSIPEYILERIY